VGLLGAEAAKPRLEALLEDEAEVSLYLSRRFIRCYMGDLAKEALVAIDQKKTVTV